MQPSEIIQDLVSKDMVMNILISDHVYPEQHRAQGEDGPAYIDMGGNSSHGVYDEIKRNPINRAHRYLTTDIPQVNLASSDMTDPFAVHIAEGYESMHHNAELDGLVPSAPKTVLLVSSTSGFPESSTELFPGIDASEESQIVIKSLEPGVELSTSSVRVRKTSARCLVVVSCFSLWLCNPLFGSLAFVVAGNYLRLPLQIIVGKLASYKHSIQLHRLTSDILGDVIQPAMTCGER